MYRRQSTRVALIDTMHTYKKMTGTTLQDTVPKRLRILIVEDEKEAARAMKRFLEFRGHAVAVAGSGLAALETAQESELQIAVCDYKIEGDLDGVDVAKELRTRFAVPVIMVTGHPLSEAKKKSRKINARISAFRRKPVSLSDLATLVESLA